MNDCPGLSILVHGPSKAGKTFLGDTAPGPRLILDVEGNSRFLKSKKVEWKNVLEAPPAHDGTWDVCFVYVRDYNTIARVYQWLAAGKHPFRSIIIDSLSEVQQRCIDAIAGDEQMKLQQWGELSRKVSSLVRQYRDLLVHPSNPVECVFFTAMTKQNGDGVQFPYVQGQLATTLPYYVDCVFYLKAQMDEESQAMKRYLLTKPRLGFDVGDRTDFFEPVVENPRIDEMLELYCKEMNGE